MNYSFHNIESVIQDIHGKDTGFFVDIGAHDGLSGSNTKYFEEKGWSGVCIEPHPDVFQKLRKNRNCKVENCAIWDTDEEVDFLAVTGYSEMLSGIMESYDSRHLQRVHRELAQHGGSSRVVKIPGKKFETIVEEKTIDFLSIDTEGSELIILSKVNFQEYDIKIICIENNFLDHSFEEFFNKRGYKLHSTHGSCDQIYIKL